MRIDDRGAPIRLDAEALNRLGAALDVDGVVSAFVFGSVATGRTTPLSDVDIGVWLDPELSSSQRLDAQLRLMADAATALHADDVDVVILNDAPPLLALGQIIEASEGLPHIARDYAAAVNRAISG